MIDFNNLLSEGSIGKSGSIVTKIQNQQDFDELFEYLFNKDRLLIKRAADAIEKITIQYPVYLTKHKKELMDLLVLAIDKGLKWHLALIMPRLSFTETEIGLVWETLTAWVTDRKESRVVRVHSLQALFNFLDDYEELTQDFHLTMNTIEPENIPSINARIRILKKASLRKMKR